MNHQIEELNSLVEDWASAELRGDTAFLDDVLADDFVGVGPRYETFGLDEVSIRPYGDAAVVVCRQSAEGMYEDENGRYDIHEQFRATLIFVKQQENWLLAGLQLSPILGRP